MSPKKSLPLSTEDTKRRAFMPIQMDLIDRLTRECDSMSSNRRYQAPDLKTDQTKLAA